MVFMVMVLVITGDEHDGHCDCGRRMMVSLTMAVMVVMVMVTTMMVMEVRLAMVMAVLLTKVLTGLGMIVTT